jgi:hypothetical protein
VTGEDGKGIFYFLQYRHFKKGSDCQVSYSGLLVIQFSFSKVGHPFPTKDVALSSLFFTYPVMLFPVFSVLESKLPDFQLRWESQSLANMIENI